MHKIMGKGEKKGGKSVKIKKKHFVNCQKKKNLPENGHKRSKANF